jgi:hypothetical protein
LKKFTCQDIGLAAYLKSRGGTVELVKEGDHFLFTFIEQEKCEQLANKYWNKQAVGNIKDYEESKQTLITMIKNQ